MVPVMIAHLGLGCVLVSFPGKSWVNVWFCVQKALARSGHDRSCHLAGQSWCPLASQSCEPKAKTGYPEALASEVCHTQGLGIWDCLPRQTCLHEVLTRAEISHFDWGQRFKAT